MDSSLARYVHAAAAAFHAAASATGRRWPACAALDQLVARLSALGLFGRDNEAPGSLLWSDLGELLRRGWLQLRAREKPRGYAGDFEMLAAIYQHRLCDDPAGRQFDHFFQAQAAPRAVRNRMRLVREWVRDLPGGKLVSVGCGSALEVADGLRERSQTSFRRALLTLSLLDLDPAAVQAAEENVSALAGPGSQCRACNLARLPSRTGWHGWLDESQLLVCTGLFDYLDDSAAAEMLRLFWSSLAPGGSLRVFNFAPWNPTRTYMEWIGAWYLTYRDRPQLHALAERAGIPSECRSVLSEPCGVNLYLTATRPLAH